MKKAFNKIKICLINFWIALISLPLKVIGWWEDKDDYAMQAMYWVQRPTQGLPSPDLTTPILKMVQYLLLGTIFIVWIISFIKIRKIDDKALKQKKIKKTVIIILIILIIIGLIWLFKKRFFG